MSSLFLIIGVIVCAVSSAAELVGEKSRGEWTVIKVAGISSTCYYSSFLFWNILIVAINIFLMAITVVIFQEPKLMVGSSFGALCLLSLLYGFDLVVLTYATEKCFHNEKEATFVGIGIHVSMGVLLSLIEFVYGNSAYIMYSLMIFPQFVFPSGFRILMSAYYNNENVGKLNQNFDSSINLSICLHLIVLISWLIFGLFVIFVSEYSSSIRSWIQKNFKKKNCSASGQASEDYSASLSLKVSDLICSVENEHSKTNLLSFNAYRSEILFLLKSETSDVVSRLLDAVPSLGETIKVYDANSEEISSKSKSQNCFSFCSFDLALDDNLTTEEELHIFSQLKDFSGNDLYEIVHRALCTFDLISVKNKITSELSFEDKKKLSLAKAAIGNPKIVILEDPFRTTSLKFHRLVLEFIRSVVNGFDSVILTSSNVTDAEDVAHRVVLFNEGSVIQSETVQYMKSGLREMYILRVTVERVENLASVIDILNEDLQDFQIINKWHKTFEAQLHCNVTPFNIFGSIAKARESIGFWYEVSIKSLSQHYEQLLMPCPRSSRSLDCTLELDRVPLTTGEDPSGIGFPTLYHGSINSFYDNLEVDLTSDLIRPSRGGFGANMRKSSGSTRLTPCSTPQPPRTEPRSSLDRISSVDLRRSLERRASSERYEVPFILQMPKKRRMTSEGVRPTGLEFPYDKPNTVNIRSLRSLGSQDIMERFLDNLSDVHQEEHPDEAVTHF